MNLKEQRGNDFCHEILNQAYLDAAQSELDNLDVQKG